MFSEKSKRKPFRGTLFSPPGSRLKCGGLLDMAITGKQMTLPQIVTSVQEEGEEYCQTRQNPGLVKARTELDVGWNLLFLSLVVSLL